ncbi:(2Fe-2S)-binding protein [Hamadaea sp. NPDC051192]|uniref:(2Fe-2S)-binding protein n=1 Tax=Hamadaea sp. NPDC051192 TaxID=3154940 RepID=UPI003412CAA5
MHGPATPLAATAARLARLDAFAGFDVAPSTSLGTAATDAPALGTATDGPAPAATGLEPTAAAGAAETAVDERTDWSNVDESRLDAWLAILQGLHGHRAVAGSLLGGALARGVVQPAVAALVLERRCPDPSASNLVVRLDEAGDFARSAVLSSAMAVLPGDPAAGDEHSHVLNDDGDLVEWWAKRTAATLTPLFLAVRARAPFGVPGLWGGAADEVSSVALWIGRLARHDPYAVWAYAQRLVGALAEHAPVRLTRPRPFPVEHPAGDHWFQVRGTCCLSYRSVLAEGDPKEDRFCSSCPLRDDDSRHRHLYAYLTSEAG